MQHDIRTPASGIYGLVQLLAEQETNLERKEILEMVRDAGKQLLRFMQ